MSMQLLKGATATGAGPSVELGKYTSVHSYQTTMDTANPTAVTVTLEGSLDGVNWHTIGTDSTVAGALVSVTGTPVQFVRANVTAYTAGTNTGVNVFYVPGEV